MLPVYTSEMYLLEILNVDFDGKRGNSVGDRAAVGKSCGNKTETTCGTRGLQPPVHLRPLAQNVLFA
jgi:hypothetical protein